MTDLEALRAFEKGEPLDQPTICQLALRGYALVEEVETDDSTPPYVYRVTLITPKGRRLLEAA